MSWRRHRPLRRAPTAPNNPEESSRVNTVNENGGNAMRLALPPNPRSETLRCVQRGARLVRQGAERRWIVHGEIGEDLPVDLDAGVFQSIDKRVVIHVVLMRGRVDALGPELAEITLFVLAVAI